MVQSAHLQTNARADTVIMENVAILEHAVMMMTTAQQDMNAIIINIAWKKWTLEKKLERCAIRMEPANQKIAKIMCAANLGRHAVK